MTTPKVILFADDDAWLNQSLIDELRETGYRVVQAGTGTEALRILDNEVIDLIVLDIMMPAGEGLRNTSEGRRTGIKVAEFVRKKRKSNVPIIYFTVISNPEVHKMITTLEHKVGIKPRILVKPIAGLQLISEIRDCLGEP